jgi:gamma-glutamyltranspeptidase / glutathione hydrolase
MTREDLAAYRVIERPPVELRAFGHRVVSSPPPSAGGYVLTSSLAMLASRPLEELRDEARFAHALAESWKGPFTDRTAYFGDPSFVDVPLAALSDPARRAERARLFDPARARPAADYALPLPAPVAPARMPDGGGTSHLCVVDAEGNVASVTTTVNLTFGARYSAAGFVMNDEMDDFARAVGASNAFGLGGGASNLPGPGRRPVSSMSPTIVFDDLGPVLCIGAAGGSRIPTATEQVALRILVMGQSADAAIRAPRMHHQGAPATLRTERFAPMPAQLRDALTARGHVIELIDNVAVVSLVHLVRGPSGVTLVGASDPRKGGQPRGR